MVLQGIHVYLLLRYLQCGSPNQMYTNMCRNCSNWGALRCVECGQNGHPASHCPDLWRRYHNTVSISKICTKKTKISKQWDTQFKRNSLRYIIIM